MEHLTLGVGSGNTLLLTETLMGAGQTCKHAKLADRHCVTMFGVAPELAQNSTTKQREHEHTQLRARGPLGITHAFMQGRACMRTV